MKRIALILALVLLLCACAEAPKPTETAPPQTAAPTETTAPSDYTQLSTQQLIADVASSPYLEYFTIGSSPYPLSPEGVQYFCTLCPQMAVLMTREGWLEELSRAAPGLIEALHQEGKGTFAVSLEWLVDYLLSDLTPPGTTAPTESIPALFCPDETTVPVETTDPAVHDFSEYEALLDFSAEPNWLSKAMGSVFETPADVNLYYLFYLGVDHPGSWDDISPESRQSLIDQGFLEEFDLQLMPAEKLEKVLQSTFGIGLADVTIPEGWGYIEAEDAYCSNHSDAYIPDAFTITDVTESGNGTVKIHYFCENYFNSATDDFLYTVDLIMTLRETEDGFQAVSNVLVNSSEYDSLYDRELIDIISTEEALAVWAASENPGSEEALADLANNSPAFAELMTRSSAPDTFAWYGPERLDALKADPETAEYAEYLALLIVSVRAS